MPATFLHLDVATNELILKTPTWIIKTDLDFQNLETVIDVDKSKTMMGVRFVDGEIEYEIRDRSEFRILPTPTPIPPH